MSEMLTFSDIKEDAGEKEKTEAQVFSSAITQALRKIEDFIILEYLAIKLSV